MTDTQQLIAEARTPHCKDCDHFMRTMADAIEATLKERDRYRAAIEEALAFESMLPAIATVPRGILTRALKENT